MANLRSVFLRSLRPLSHRHIQVHRHIVQRAHQAPFRAPVRHYANGSRQIYGYQQGGGRARLLWRFVASPYFFYSMGGLGVASGAFYIYNLEEVPFSKRRRFMIVSEETEKETGEQLYQQTMEQFAGQILPPSDARVRLVRRVLNRLVPHSGLSDADNTWEVNVIHSDQKNAFVIPGGKVFVFSGIFDICQGEAGLAAVLGHEIAHNVAHHSAERLSQYMVLMPVTVVIMLLLGFGDFGLTRVAIDLAFTRPGSRTQESEADYIGLMMMAKACYNPEAAVGLWARMEQAERNAPPQFLSTHPSSHNRMEKIRDWLPEAQKEAEESNCAVTGRNSNGFFSTIDRYRM